MSDEKRIGKGKLVLIDGHAFAYRAYYALPPDLSTSKGELTNAVFGFTSMLLNVLSEERPDYMAVAFDVGKSFRHEEYAPYKATRAKMPKDLAGQLKRIHQMVETLGIPILELEGYEADDILGTLASWAEEKGLEVLIVTGDTDTFQLIDENTKVLTSRRRFSDTVIYDEAGIRARYGVEPKQLVDFKALTGDRSDNIPGVKGVGKKTATRLLRRYGSLEGIYEHLDEVESTRFRNALEEGRRDAFLSKRLVAIVRDVPLKLDLEGCRLGEFDREEVMELFRELEFRSLVDKLPPAKGQKPPQQLSMFEERKRPTSGDYRAITGEDALNELVARLAQVKGLAFDTETTGTDPISVGLVGISLAANEGKAYYIPVGHESGRQLPRELVLDKLRPILEDSSIPKYAHNSKYDLTVLARYGVQVEGLAFDTMIAEWLINPASKNLGLKNLAWARLGVEMKPITDLIGKGKAQITMAQVPIAQATAYACLNRDSPVLLGNGKTMKIGEIVNKRLSVQVLCMNEQTGRMESKRVVNWFKRLGSFGQKWCKIVTKYTQRSKWGTPIGPVFTPDHKVLTTEGWKTVADLATGDKVYAPEPQLTHVQTQLILGSCLGDGSLERRNGRLASFYVGHGERQREYLRFKASILKNVVDRPERMASGSGIGRYDNAAEFWRIQTRCLRGIADLWDIMYPNGKKTVTQEWLDRLDAIGLAFWYMDDGVLANPISARFIVHALSDEEIALVQAYMKERWGFESRLYRDKRKRRGAIIALTSSSSRRFFELIAPYVHPSMQYKLPPEYRGGFQQGFLDNVCSTVPYCEEVVEVMEYKPNQCGTYRMRYCIEVEGNHNFFTTICLAKNCADVDMTYRLMKVLEPELKEKELWPLFTQVEMPLVRVLSEMEMKGVKLDVDFLHRMSSGLQGHLASLERQIQDMVGYPFNVNSTQQLSEALFVDLGLPAQGVPKTKTGYYSTAVGVLEKLKDEHPVIDLILEYRKLSKLKSTYVDALPGLVNERTGRIHTSYNQTGTVTGRVSCLPAGTLVNTQRGLVGIEAVRPGDLIRTPYGPRRILNWQATGEKSVVVLKLSNGVTLRCSPQHRLRSKGVWVKAKDITVGTPVYMSFTEGLFGERTELHLDYTSEYHTYKTPSLPTKWTVDLAELAGYYMADGHIARSNYNDKPAKVVLAFSWNEDELMDHFSGIIQRIFGKAPTWRVTNSCPVLEVSGVDIGGTLEQLGAGGHSSEIRVPPGIFAAPEPVVAAFLRGYFEGDGCVSDQISVRSVSRAMLEDIQQLLTLFGIPSSISEGSPDRRGYARRYTLRIVGDRSKRVFHDRIGFLSTKKRKACAELAANRSKKSTAELLTLPDGFDIGALKPHLYAAHRGSDGRVPRAIIVFAHKFAAGRQTITLPRAEWIVNSLPNGEATQEADFLHEVVGGQYYEVTVNEISYEAPVPMYDIAVEEVEQHIAQGIIVHNSSEPNLQNIPIRTELGRQVRRAFVAAPGHLLLSADYSQVELRILAHISGDEGLLSAFRRGEDIHTSTAAALYDMPLEEVRPEMRRLAKCVVRGTLVYTSRGLQAIEILGERPRIGQFMPLNDLSVVTDGSEKKATHLYFDGRRPIRKITVKTGLSIACTHRHKLRVVNKAGDYFWKAAGEIECGDYLTVIKGSRVFSDDYGLPKVEFPSTLRVTNYKDLSIPSYWTPELARFLGYVISEGYLYRHKTKPHTGCLTLSQSLTEEEITKDLIKVSRALFGDRPKVKQRKGNIFVQIHSSKLLYWLKALGIHGKSDNKTIPDVLLAAPYQIQAEFLRALFSGNGSLKKGGREITYSTKSLQLANRLQQMLLNFGYLFSLYVENRKGRKEAYYTLSLMGIEDVHRFLDEIGFISEHKQTPGQAVFTCDRSVIPYQNGRIRELYPFLKGQVKEKAYEVLRANQPVNLNRTRAEMVVRHLKATGLEHPALNELENLLGKNLVFLPVTAIEEGGAEVYDLFVPDGNTYVAKGFVSHNTVNFGIAYGMGSYGLAQRTGLSREEASHFIKSYFAKYPKVKKYVEGTKRRAHKQGYVETLFGRRRYFPELTSKKAHWRAKRAAEREAINMPIQGTAADILKIAMINLHYAIRERGLKGRMILQVHDELVLEVPEDELKTVKPLVKSTMEGAFKLDAPLKVDLKMGRNWLEMEPVGA